jgi:hypothetical protein
MLQSADFFSHSERERERERERGYNNLEVFSLSFCRSEGDDKG